MQPAGHVDARFQPVAEAFLDGFEQGREAGAGLAVILDGTPVVDIWHGDADRRGTRPWQQDTLVCMHSVTKAMTAFTALLAVDRGLLPLDEPASGLWPEFAGAGKESVTLRHLLNHQAGVVGFHQPVDRDILYDWRRCIAALEGESPWWSPGTAHGYHARTFGYLVGELISRATGSSPGRWFHDQIAAPLGLDFYIGLPDEALERCADMLPARMRTGDESKLPAATRELMASMRDLSTPTGAAFQNPAMGAGYANSTQFRQAEIPAANGHGTPRSVARMYDQMASLLSRDLLAEATSTQSLGPDRVLKTTTHFGLGLMLHHQESPIGLRPGTYGHAGAGGSMGFHDPEARLSFCYAMNQMEMGVINGGVSANLTAKAVYDCL